MAAIPSPTGVRIRVESNRTFIRATASWIEYSANAPLVHVIPDFLERYLPT